MTTLCEQVQRRKYETHRDWVARVMFHCGWTEVMYDGAFDYGQPGLLPFESFAHCKNITHFVTDGYFHLSAGWASNGRFKCAQTNDKVWWTVREFLSDNACLLCDCDRCWDGVSEDVTTAVLR